MLLLSLGGLLAGAGVAHADPGLSPADQQYVRELAEHGIRNQYGAAVMVEDGREVCAALDGFTFPEEVGRIRLTTNLDGPHAVYFVQLSHDTYCPERSARTDDV
ncbi:hypothetical protein MCOL_V219211 [Mycobacterium colombiense CECT 3035]|uniref:DUF732 domain-containing protein n=1 Tax=Mycobacterium colombiense CECT 3035 TaxID=1041522 RepID=J5E035_9MYCO|nr:hypothetical protein MCOL_V219211 [Mycobacterium colombiense CECT 3035]